MEDPKLDGRMMQKRIYVHCRLRTGEKTRTEDKLAWKKIVEQAKTHPGL
jgi:hypothetical protein